MSQESVHAKAALVRDHRAEVKAQVQAGELPFAGIFAAATSDAVVAETKLLGLIESIPDIGKVQSRRAFEAVGIAETIRVGAVVPEQQQALASALGIA